MLDDGVDKVGDTPTVTTTRAPAMLKIVIVTTGKIVILAEVVSTKIQSYAALTNVQLLYLANELHY